MNCAPIALFAYNRLPHVRQTVEALSRNPEAGSSELFIFSDGAKNAAGGKAVSEVRQYLRQITGFAAVHIIERTENYGLARSIIDGVSQICGTHNRVIVLEDDIVTSPYFLKFMNEALDRYERDERVISIHGYVYPVAAALPETFFLAGADCWGWATWKRGWDLFEPDGRLLLRELTARKLAHRFDFDGAYPYTKMLKAQIKGKNDSWAIRWHASAFLRGKLTLYPGRSLVLNIGADNTGMHCSATNEFSGGVADSPIALDPIAVEENLFARQQIIKFHKAGRPRRLMRALHKLVRMVRRAG